jgi:hypothetical protein
MIDSKTALEHADSLATLRINMIALRMAIEGIRDCDKKEADAVAWLLCSCSDQLDELTKKFNAALEKAYPPAAA